MQSIQLLGFSVALGLGFFIQTYFHELALA